MKTANELAAAMQTIGAFRADALTKLANVAAAQAALASAQAEAQVAVAKLNTAITQAQSDVGELALTV